MNLSPNDTIITAWAEPASGPGWRNLPIWVIVRDGTGKLRQDCIQPDEQTPEMVARYEYSALASRKMLAAVVAAGKGKPKRSRGRKSEFP